LCDDEQHLRTVNPYLPLLFSISSWPHCLDPPVLHIDYLIPGSANHIFEYTDDSFLEKLTRLNREVFEMIHPFWHLLINGGSHSRLHSRHFSSKGCLGILLHWMAHGIARTPLAVIVSSVSRYMRLGYSYCMTSYKISLQQQLLVHQQCIFNKLEILLETFMGK
jgi:hypothetical protein